MVKKKVKKEWRAFTTWTLHTGTSILFGVLFLFLATNILFAVSLPDIDSMISDSNKELVDFMKRARKISSFQRVLYEMKTVFAAHEQEVYKDDRERQQKISRLEEILIINPKSRDVLYSLYLLYDKAGDEQKADEYLQRAKEVDPRVEGN